MWSYPIVRSVCGCGGVTATEPKYPPLDIHMGDIIMKNGVHCDLYAVTATWSKYGTHHYIMKLIRQSQCTMCIAHTGQLTPL